MSIRGNILNRAYVAVGMIFLFALAIVYKMYVLQVVQGKYWKSKSDSLSTRYFNIEATRGNIYSVDGSLLATSVPEYELRMDMLAAGIERDEVFYSKVDSLAEGLAGLFKNKTAREYSRMLRIARKEKSRYLLINRKVSYQDLKQARQLPIFNLGRYKGGLIAEEKNKRILPFGSLAARTIGYKRDNIKPVGLEGAYGDYIDGITGKKLMQRIAGGVWIPVNSEEEISPREGADIISTIDINLQDVAQSALERQLIKSNADFGCVVLMETATGEVRAIANYSKVSEGIYKELFNYAVAQSAEPGSTFKLASYLVAMDQDKFHLNDVVDVSGGEFKIYNHTIKDDHEAESPVITMKHAFEMSSNVAIAKQIYRFYRENPSEFTNKLHDIHLGEELGLEIPGEGKPLIKSPQSKSWSGLSLPQMAYGYESKLTPLQTLVLYNAVANNGKMIAPIFVKDIRELGKPIKTFSARVINEQICSEKTLRELKEMLVGVVKNGTARAIDNQAYQIAGKTGTAQVANGAAGYTNPQYQASFCGYFPAENPKYSMIVLIHNPTQGSYYAAQIAGPVFREISDRVFARDVSLHALAKKKEVAKERSTKEKEEVSIKKGNRRAAELVCRALKVDFSHQKDSIGNIDFENPNIPRGVVPDVKGMGLNDAVYLLSNAGFVPKVVGKGRVISQSVAAGTRVNKKALVSLQLN